MSYRVSAKSLEMLRNGHITAHNLKVAGSNPAPATIDICTPSLLAWGVRFLALCLAFAMPQAHRRVRSSIPHFLELTVHVRPSDDSNVLPDKNGAKTQGVDRASDIFFVRF